jgi:hypothetical protein
MKRRDIFNFYKLLLSLLRCADHEITRRILLMWLLFLVWIVPQNKWTSEAVRPTATWRLCCWSYIHSNTSTYIAGFCPGTSVFSPPTLLARLSLGPGKRGPTGGPLLHAAQSDPIAAATKLATRNPRDVNLSRCLIKHHTMKMYGEWRYTSTILTSALDGEWSASRPYHLTLVPIFSSNI